MNPSYHNSAGISKIFSEITNIMSLLTQLTKLLNMYINLFLEKIIMEYSIMKQVFFFFLSLRLQMQRRLSGVQVFWWVFSAAIAL